MPSDEDGVRAKANPKCSVTFEDAISVCRIFPPKLATQIINPKVSRASPSKAAVSGGGTASELRNLYSAKRENAPRPSIVQKAKSAALQCRWIASCEISGIS